MKNCKMCINTTMGFTLIEVLVALLVVSISITMLNPIVRTIHILSKTHYESEDYLAIQQLRRVLAQSYDVNQQGNELHFRYHQENTLLNFHNNRLVKQPGYEIYLQDIDHVNIQQKGDCYELSWTRKQSEHKALLVCE